MTQIPSIQYAVQIAGKEELVANPAKPIDPIGPTQIMFEAEACDICFSDMKLPHQFNSHPRKSDVVADIDPDALKNIPSYHPNQEAVAPGRGPVMRIVQVGEEVTHLKVSDRLLVQADWKHLRAVKSSGTFGYNFDDVLEEYVVINERCVVSPDGEEFLIHVSEGPSAAAVGLIEPWAAVEGSYTWAGHNHVTGGGRLLIIGEGDIDALTVEHEPAEVMHVAIDAIKGVEGEFDDVVFFGADTDAIEKATLLIDTRGTMRVVLGGEKIPRKVSLGIGRIHYDFTRFCSTTDSGPREGYAWIPTNDGLRENDCCVFIGAAGPIGVMHTTHTVTSGVPGFSVVGTNLSDGRLENLTRVVSPTAEKNGMPLDIVNTSSTPLEYGCTYTTYFVPVPALVSQAVNLLAEGGILDTFAGIPVGAFDDFDPRGIIERQIFILGAPGSDVLDMRTILREIEAGIIGTATSLWAITGMAGFGDAIDMVMDHTSGGKIMAFPMMRDLNLTPVSRLAEKLPMVAAELNIAGLWAKEAEEALPVTC